VASYEAVLADPASEAARLARFVAGEPGEMDAEEMARAVETSLCHHASQREGAVRGA
jgi:hypothetical protein